MKIEQLYTGCLAEAAYYIESDGEVAIIDPIRETNPYIKRAQKDKATIKYIFETHFHADFVSGHLELSKLTGATIVFGPKASTNFACHIATDNEVFKVGKVTIKALHTPGHTLESTTYLLIDENGKEHCIFTGDTLFIGDVGRPDLAIKSDVTQEDLAGMLYDSLHVKIMPLADDVIVYPAHGAGSACGKSMSKETSDTLGHQKKVNYALQDISKQEFIKQVTEGLLSAPQYFAKNALLNKNGAGTLQDVFIKGLQPLLPEQFEQIAETRKALILDTRDAQVFAKAFIPTAINIGINGQFAVWVGTLITDLEQPILLVCEPGKAEECVTRLARVGYDNTIGYLEGGMDAWIAAAKQTDSIESVTPINFAAIYHADTLNILDVRKPTEYETEHVAKAENKPLDFINEWMPEVDRNTTYYVHCGGGYRSMTASSILKARGFKNIIEIAGGYTAIAQTNIAKNNTIHEK